MIAEKDVMDMRRCVIVGGAEIRTYDRVRQYFRPDDFFIYCDCGLRHQKALGAEPDLIVGDFDSHEKPETDRETIVLPVKKDDTDTVFAAKEAMRRGFDEFLLVGVSGGRLDHTLVNVYLLVMLREQGTRVPLDNGEIHCGYQYGTSNEVLPGQTAVVSVKEGLLLLIKDFPEV